MKLGLVGGAALKDPRGLLEGSGKRHRYVQFNQSADVDRAGLDQLLEGARRAAKAKRDE